MLKCKDISLQASDYLEKQLPVKQRLGYAFHLLMCGHCRAFVQHMEKAITVFQELPAQELSEEEAAQIVREVDARSEESSND